MTIDPEHIAVARTEVMNQARLPAWDKINERARDRRLRTRTSFAAVAVILLAIGVTALPAIGGQRGTIAATAEMIPAEANRCAVYAATEKETYVVYGGGRYCARGADFFYARTVDGGRTWQTRRVPAEANCGAAVPTVTPLASGIAVMCRLITHDSGDSWDPTPAGEPPVDAVPPGWMILPYTSVATIDGRLTAIDPATGRSALLAHSLALPGGELALIKDTGWPRLNADGSIWATTSDGAWACGRISLDRGRTWRTVTPAGPQSDLVTLDGRVGYVMKHADGNDAQILRTTDSGRTWHPVANAPRFPELLAIPGGGLIGFGVSSSVGLSADGGRTFHRIDGISGPVERIATGSYVVDHGAAVSDDGVHYQSIQPPR